MGNQATLEKVSEFYSNYDKSIPFKVAMARNRISYTKNTGVEISFSMDKPLGFRYGDNSIVIVYPNSQASNANVRVGWRIIAMNGKKHSSDRDKVKETLKRKKEEGDNVIILRFETHAQLPDIHVATEFGSGLLFALPRASDGIAVVKLQWGFAYVHQDQIALIKIEKKEVEISFSSDKPFGFRFDGNCVEMVYLNSQASKAKIPEGWYITKINGQTQSNVHSEVKETLIRAKKEGENVLIVFSETDNQGTGHVISKEMCEERRKKFTIRQDSSRSRTTLSHARTEKQ